MFIEKKGERTYASATLRVNLPNSLKGPTGFDSETNGNVSMSSAGQQLVNLIFYILKGDNNYALAA
ncbi:hypothetical protein MNBD_BACTEROID03-2058 [hydrothermal vent metagenome]|uniref:Uncharacterized protein n=1 Tax=hydrothermal vent metagenome TaxID=652676 RepID=A0A3B0T8T1_9ZZZZ